ncbi:hypothetical protein AXF42_Ash020450 [Apostasia shenzhenica]|uniref:Uncharacterized protein n=1 Tax=Apostasia shenzhenica TaxID=1088818 RepID=A0A2H9ZYI1_9ASPA|nr:hypothetical protein AXF42_Ash020450 [Apostasia shenzhenica]
MSPRSTASKLRDSLEMTEIRREVTSHSTMSIYRMPSLKSSVGSKSTSFQPSATAAGEVGGCLAFREDPPAVLHSSWISRLRPAPSPSAACGRDGIHSPFVTVSDGAPAALCKHTVSTDESRTASSSVYNLKSFIAGRHLGFPPRNRPPAPQLRRDNRGDDDEGRIVASFGPFLIRAPRKTAGSYRREGRVFEKGNITGDGCFPLCRRITCHGVEREEEIGEGRNLGILEKKGIDAPVHARPSPSIFQSQVIRPATVIHGRDEFGMEKEIVDFSPHRNANRFMDTDLVSSSWIGNHYRPRNDESSLHKPYPITDTPLIRVHDGHSRAGSWIASSSQQAARSRGFSPYHDVSEDSSLSRNFQDIHSHHHNSIPQQPDRQVAKIEAEEQFSFWNMGRFKRTNFVSSVIPSFDLACDFSRKRKPRTIDFASFKFQRLGGKTSAFNRSENL